MIKIVSNQIESWEIQMFNLKKHLPSQDLSLLWKYMYTCYHLCIREIGNVVNVVKIGAR